MVIEYDLGYYSVIVGLFSDFIVISMVMIVERLNEKRKHGTSDFPSAMYLLDRLHPRYVMTPHWHVEYEILHVECGTFMLTLNGEEIAMNKGDLGFFPSGVIHSGYPKRGCVYKCLVFNMGLIENSSFSFDSIIRTISEDHIQIKKTIRLEEYEKLEDIRRPVESIFAVAEFQTEISKLQLVADLLSLFSALYKEHMYIEPFPESGRSKRRIIQIKRSLELIHSSYSRQITLEEMAAAAGLSEKYFCSFFKKLINKTPVEYLNLFRIEQACSMMTDSDKSLMEISMDCGFTDYSYFSRVFAKVTGESPATYRKSHSGR